MLLNRHSLHRVLTLATILPFALPLGCSTLVSEKQNVGGPSYASGSKARVGLYYFLPKALLTIQATQTTDPTQFQLSVTRTFVADQRQRYHLRWTQNPFYDDVIATSGITVNDQGLLTSVPFTATDQTPNIVNDLANTTVNVFKILGGGAPAAPGALKIPKPESATLKPFKYTFDPLDIEETRVIEAKLRKFGIVVSICPVKAVTQSCIGGHLADSGKSNEVAEAEINKDTPPSGGVMYHPPITIELRLDFSRTGTELVDRETIMLPDVERVACFRFGRSPFVNRDTLLTLSSGMPTSFYINRPSPLKGFTGLLSTVTGTVAAGIPTILNVKDNRQEANLAAQKQLIDAQTALITSQNSLTTALAAQKKSSPTPGPGTPPARTPGPSGVPDTAPGVKADDSPLPLAEPNAAPK